MASAPYRLLAGLAREKVERVSELEAVAQDAEKYLVAQDMGAGANNPWRLALREALRAAGYLKEAE